MSRYMTPFTKRVVTKYGSVCYCYQSFFLWNLHMWARKLCSCVKYLFLLFVFPKLKFDAISKQTITRNETYNTSFIQHLFSTCSRSYCWTCCWTFTIGSHNKYPKISVNSWAVCLPISSQDLDFYQTLLQFCCVWTLTKGIIVVVLIS
jgi:hypothetical protein